MNTPSPLIPQGATPPRTKSSIYFKVLMILTVHVVVIGGMLLQGCKDTTPTNKTDVSQNTTSSSDTTAAATPTVPNTPDTSSQAALPTPNSLSNATMNPTAMTPTAPQTAQTAPVEQAMPPSTLPTSMAPVPPVTGEGKEYVIVRGDTLGKIARHNGVSLKALMDANPGVNPRKLQVGQKLQIPAGAVAATTAAPGAAEADSPTAASDSSVYKVKSGDILLRIARAHGTTVKKIMALNDLKSTSIRVGQKLKMPAPKATAPVDATAPAAAASASIMQPPAAGAPVSVSASAATTPSPTAAN